MFAVYEGITKIRDPHELDSLGWAIGILVVAIVAEGLSLRTAVKESRPLKGSHSWRAFIRRAKVPELPVVLQRTSARSSVSPSCSLRSCSRS